MRIVALPAKRLARLIKNKAKALDELSKKAGVKIRQAGVERGRIGGGIEIDGAPEKEWIAELAWQAIEIGFEPKEALRLLQDDYYFEVVDLKLLLQGNEKAMERLKARVIGAEGKSKARLIEYSGASIAVGEESIGIIGGFDEVQDAKEAVTRLLEGSQHAPVFSWLRERQRLREARRLGVKI